MKLEKKEDAKRARYERYALQTTKGGETKPRWTERERETACSHHKPQLAPYWVPYGPQNERFIKTRSSDKKLTAATYTTLSILSSHSYFGL